MNDKETEEMKTALPGTEAEAEAEAREEKANGASYPDLLTVSPSPHLRNSDSTRTVMTEVIIALIPALVWGIITFGLRALTVTIISVVACVGFEALAQLALRRPITVSDMSAALTGLFIALNMPVSAPLWIPVVASFFAVVVVKQVFGGIGKNIVNPAMAARVFVMLSWAGQMTKFTAAGARYPFFGDVAGGYDAVATATPLAALKSGNVPEASLFDMFTGKIGGCIGEVSTLLLLLGGIYLLVRRIISWHIPVAYLGTVAVLTYAFPKTGDAVSFMLYELMAGGLVLGAFFMATDYTTSPISPVGRIVYGIGCGALTVLIRYFGGYPEGTSFAILIMNLLVWYLDSAFKPRWFGASTLKKREREKKKAEKAEKA